MKIRSLLEMVEVIDSDLVRRTHELTTVNRLLLKTKDRERAVVARAAICLLYAHWEGFIKTAGTAYAGYVASKGLKYREMAPNFVAFGLRNRVRDLAAAKRMTLHAEFARYLMSDFGDDTNLPWESTIDCESNLNSAVLADILAALGLDATSYITKGVRIDHGLLRQRNLVAHGALVAVDADDYDTLREEIITLLRQFRDDVQNAAALAAFRRR